MKKYSSEPFLNKSALYNFQSHVCVCSVIRQVPGCRGSGLMQAFTKHLVPRLGIRQEASPPDRLRVTLLSRSSKQRRIVNENEVIHTIKYYPVFGSNTFTEGLAWGFNDLLVDFNRSTKLYST